MSDPVNHPAHYTEHPSGIECIQITEHMCFNLGNAFKYIWRADLKGSALEDLEKARWYIDRELTKRSSERLDRNPEVLARLKRSLASMTGDVEIQAPAEAGPWERIEDVPKDVTRIEDCEGDTWFRTPTRWICEDGSQPAGFAPFTAIEGVTE
ncbi:DUF3310 domain-containing protein [Rhodococcus globerulus]|uniref:DUF3310 domain-containing protein n=1 Tax=Rhodococcus globerulus TaxID=33008 RepID=UPI001C55E9D1|nr:DUF3310 domain-containing protein [Rhodococcus globerulus]QXW04038.1 DUF3310 domain-containing protein [Rhodococcus globerulus]